jgi:hypothetical protein
VKRSCPLKIRNSHLKIDIAGSKEQDFVETGSPRLDINPGPSLIVEVLSYRVPDWVSSPDVNVESSFLVLEDPCQPDIFSILGVGNDRRQNALSFL